MKRLLLLVFTMVFASTLPLSAQLERPGAFDVGDSGCKGLFCIWSSALTTHQHLGGYEFFLDASSDNENIPIHLIIRRNRREMGRALLKDLSASVAVTWASDFRAFAVTWSDGGAIGAFHVKVFQLKGERFIELPSAKTAFAHFKSRHDCRERGDNIQAYRFKQDGAQLMLILSVYDTSDCGRQMGYTEGYLVRVSDGAILQRLTSRQLDAYLRRHPEGS